jgi:hypothetical protein
MRRTTNKSFLQILSERSPTDETKKGQLQSHKPRSKNLRQRFNYDLIHSLISAKIKVVPSAIIVS